MLAYSELVRRLGSSRFNYWFGYVANGLWVLYFVHTGLPNGPAPLAAWQLLLAAVSGLLLWTLLEYVLHRYVYHEWPSFLSHGHGLHHGAPRELIGVPWWLTSVALLGLFSLLRQPFHEGAVGVTMGFCWAGYIAYCLLHHGSHHWAMRSSYLRRVKRAHQLHHAHPGYNWGFTTSLWDRAFGTFLTDGARARSASRPTPPGSPRRPARPPSWQPEPSGRGRSTPGRTTGSAQH